MFLGLLKRLKDINFYEKKKKIIETRTLHKRKVHIKKKERVCEFMNISD